MSDPHHQGRAGAGWDSDLPTFSTSPPLTVAARLADFVRDAGTSQLAAWRKDVPWLQRELSAYLARRPEAADDWTVLEYELPREFRRPDVIVLKNGCVVVHELPGYLNPTKAALREATFYAQDLSAYRSYRQARYAESRNTCGLAYMLRSSSSLIWMRGCCRYELTRIYRLHLRPQCFGLAAQEAKFEGKMH